METQTKRTIESRYFYGLENVETAKTKIRTVYVTDFVTWESVEYSNVDFAFMVKLESECFRLGKERGSRAISMEVIDLTGEYPSFTFV